MRDTYDDHNADTHYVIRRDISLFSSDRFLVRVSHSVLVSAVLSVLRPDIVSGCDTLSRRDTAGRDNHVMIRLDISVIQDVIPCRDTT